MDLEHPDKPTPAGNKPPPRRAPGERQEAILAAALDVFSEHGFAAARLDDIATRAGVAKGTLYLYFPDKETLFEQMLTSVAAPPSPSWPACPRPKTCRPPRPSRHCSPSLRRKSLILKEKK